MGVIDLTYTESLAAETEPILRRAERVIPRVEWPLHAPYIAAINRLKRERNAVILAHNYQVPEIFYTVADIVGDSLALAMQAAATDADVIVLCGVHFMAETAKLVNPSKTVLVPDLLAGCSLAESITAADVRLLRERYPGTPVVTYVNTSAEVKAESDVCVTSGNAVQIVEALGVPRVIFLPDEYLAKYVASKTKVEIVAWKGHCEVHERFTGEDVRRFRRDDPTLVVLAHPGMSARRARRGRLRGLDARHVGVRGDRRARARPAHDRVLDGRQRVGPLSGGRVRPPLQPVPAHEAQHVAEGAAQPRGDGVRGDDRSRDRAARAARRRPDARLQPRGPRLSSNSWKRSGATRSSSGPASPV